MEECGVGFVCLGPLVSFEVTGNGKERNVRILSSSAYTRKRRMSRLKRCSSWAREVVAEEKGAWVGGSDGP